MDESNLDNESSYGLNETAILSPYIFWYHRNFGGLGLLRRLLFEIVPSFYVLFSSTHSPFFPHSILLYFSYWVVYIPFYEIGYLINDTWSHDREIKRGSKRKLKWIKHASRHQLLIAILLRVLLGICLFLALSFIVPNSAPLLGVIIASMIFFFSLHNAIFLPYRLMSYFLLAMTRFLLITPLNRNIILATLIISTPLAIGQALSYLLTKLAYHSSIVIISPAHHIKRTFLLCMISFLLASAFAPAYYEFFVNLFLYFLFLDFLFYLKRILFGVWAAIYDMHKNHYAYHVHSSISHDANMSLQQIEHIASNHRFRFVAITDHVEDIDAEKYISIKSQCDRLNRNGLVTFLPGIEYECFAQHVLAINLDEYINPRTYSQRDLLLALRLKSSRLILAHPRLSLRRSFSIRYLREYFFLLENVSSLEYKNLKSAHRLYFRYRELIVLCIALYFFPEKNLTIGLDTHSAADWPFSS